MPQYDDQKIRQLAQRLKGTADSVYEVAPAVLGCKSVGSVVHKHLERAGVFQCEVCDVWKDVSERSEIITPEHADWCKACCRRPATEETLDPKAD